MKSYYRLVVTARNSPDTSLTENVIWVNVTRFPTRRVIDFLNSDDVDFVYTISELEVRHMIKDMCNQKKIDYSKLHFNFYYDVSPNSMIGKYGLLPWDVKTEFELDTRKVYVTMNFQKLENRNSVR